MSTKNFKTFGTNNTKRVGVYDWDNTLIITILATLNG